jgi:hypothetical protein
MLIKLECEIEENRWIVKFLSGEYFGLSGDYQLRGGNSLKKGDVFEARAGRTLMRPSVHHASGKLFLDLKVEPKGQEAKEQDSERWDGMS